MLRIIMIVLFMAADFVLCMLLMVDKNFIIL